MGEGKEKVLYVAPSMSTFVKSDLRLLSGIYQVEVNTYDWRKKSRVPFYLFHQLVVLLAQVYSLKAIIVSFGGYWSVLPALMGRLFHIPVYIILNGTDCADFPAMNYGSLRRPMLRRMCYYSYKWARTLLPVSSSLVRSQNTYFSDAENWQGFQYFFPKLTTPHQVVYNGLDADFWQADTRIQRQPKTFITVMSGGQFVLKGGDLICRVAKQFPDCQFYFAGLKGPEIEIDVPANVTFLGRLTPEELRQYYSQCTFYFQLSIFEGFGCALSEAMLCGCVPIGSSVNFIPGIIGKSGFILEKRDVGLLEALLQEVIALEEKELTQLSERARKSVAERFGVGVRKEALLNIIESTNNDTK